MLLGKCLSDHPVGLHLYYLLPSSSTPHAASPDWCWAISWLLLLFFFLLASRVSHLLPSHKSTGSETARRCGRIFWGSFSNQCAASDLNTSLMHNEQPEINDETVKHLGAICVKESSVFDSALPSFFTHILHTSLSLSWCEASLPMKAALFPTEHVLRVGVKSIAATSEIFQTVIPFHGFGCKSPFLAVSRVLERVRDSGWGESWAGRGGECGDMLHHPLCFSIPFRWL